MTNVEKFFILLYQLGGFLFVAWVLKYAGDKFRSAHEMTEYAKTIPGGIWYAEPNSEAERREFEEAREELEWRAHA